MQSEPVANERAANPWPVRIGLRKFVLMSFFTIGLYDVYWFYWNWRRERDIVDRSIHAGLLTFLSPFTALLLFRDVQKDERSHATWPPVLLAIMYFVMIISFVGPGWSWIFTLFAFLPLMPVQQSMNRIHDEASSTEQVNDSFTLVNICGMFFGAAVMILLFVLGRMIDSGAFDGIMSNMAPLLQQ